MARNNHQKIGAYAVGVYAGAIAQQAPTRQVSAADRNTINRKTIKTGTSLGRLYAYWAVAILTSFIISGIYVYVATMQYIADLPAGEDTDFAMLPYLAYAHIVGVACTGFVLSFLVLFWGKSTKALNALLAKWVLVIHVIYAAIIALLIHKIWVIFFNPFAFMLLANLPYVSWVLTYQRRHKLKKSLFVLLALVAICSVYLMIQWLVLVSQG